MPCELNLRPGVHQPGELHVPWALCVCEWIMCVPRFRACVQCYAHAVWVPAERNHGFRGLRVQGWFLSPERLHMAVRALQLLSVLHGRGRHVVPCQHGVSALRITPGPVPVCGRDVRLRASGPGPDEDVRHGRQPGVPVGHGDRHGRRGVWCGQFVHGHLVPGDGHESEAVVRAPGSGERAEQGPEHLLPPRADVAQRGDDWHLLALL